MPRLRGDTGLPARYRAVLGLPGTAGFFAAAAVARLGVAMTPLSVLWAVRGATGSFAAAGVTTAAFAVAEAIAGPQVARLVEEHGQRRVLPWSAGVFVLAAAALIAAAWLGLPLAPLAALAMLAGASVPQVGALSAARWRPAVRSREQAGAALSLEAAVNDVTHLGGPILVSAASAVLYPAAGLTLAAGLVAAGLTAFLWQRRSEPPTQPRSAIGHRRLVDRRLLTPAVITLFGLNLALGFFFGAVPVTLTAFAFAHQAPALAGPIAAVSSLTSLTAGLVYGARGGRRQPMTVILLASSFLTVGTAALCFAASVPAMFAGYAVVGAAIAPILIPAALLLQHATEPAVYTQATTWMNSASAAGIAVAAPLAGLAVQDGGWRLGFVAAAALTATLPAIAGAARARSGGCPGVTDRPHGAR